MSGAPPRPAPHVPGGCPGPPGGSLPVRSAGMAGTVTWSRPPTSPPARAAGSSPPSRRRGSRTAGPGRTCQVCTRRDVTRGGAPHRSPPHGPLAGTGPPRPAAAGREVARPTARSLKYTAVFTGRCTKLTRDDLRHHLSPVHRVPRGRRPAPADLARPGRVRRRCRRHRALRRGVVRAVRVAEPEPERGRRPGPRAREPAPAGGRLRCGPRRLRLRPPGARRGGPRGDRGRPGERRLLARRRRRRCWRGRRCRRAGHHLAGGGARDPDRGLRSDRAARPGGRRARLRARGLARHRGRGHRRGPHRYAGPGHPVGQYHRRDRSRHRGGPLPGRSRRPPGRHPDLRPGRGRVHPPRPVGGRPLAARPLGRQPPRPSPGRGPRPPDPHHRHPHRPGARLFLQRPHRASLRPPRPGRPAAARRCAMSAPRGSVFRYRDYAVDADRGVLSCRYELDGREFTERVTLPPGEQWHTGQARAAARLVFLLSGVSYYKTAAPPVIDVGATALTGAEATFLREFYLQGLAEFAYRNDLDLSGVSLGGVDPPQTPPAPGGEPFPPAPPRPPTGGLRAPVP